MISKLRKKGITNKKVLTALEIVPRHFFMDTALEDYAYEDKAYPITANQTISQPYTVALQTQLLELNKGEKVLEIGTGSGYQSAILLAYGDLKVFTIERQNELFKKTSLLFKKLGLKPKKTIFGDGYLGYPKEAPFDSILVTAGVIEVPKSLLSQLAIGGRLVIPIGYNEQIMTRYIRKGEKDFDIQTYGSFKFVPLLKNKN